MDTPSTETRTFYGALKYIAEGLINRYLDKLIVFLTPPHGSGDTVPEHLPNAITGQVYSAYAQAAQAIPFSLSFFCECRICIYLSQTCLFLVRVYNT
ncbi:hypothetical protein UY286_09190 [Paenibacillus polymyxa]|uniref:hypothetical protein n=1 Tax=Paenibacillus polymyxa TaxID=1406 RepID=UPI002AB3EA30|nr:hypothetical protein [Paenibacillus polymyxa]MDY8117614.1 hypothetical protein [Paenibacillus polymyxa]